MSTQSLPMIDPVRDGHTFYRQPDAGDTIYRAQMTTGDTVWVVSRYDDVAAILRDGRYVQTKAATLTPDERAAQPVTDKMAQHFEGKNMLEADPPVHTRLRGLVHKAFTPKLIEGMRPRIQQITDALFDAIEARGDGTMEFIQEFAFPMPVIVIAEVLGLPTEDRDRFRAWTEVMTRAPSDDPAYVEAQTATMIEFMQYFAEQFALRRVDPRDDLITGLVTAHDQGDRLDEVELHSMVMLLLAAGHETTVNLLGNSVLALLENPDQMERLRQQPELIELAVEEFLRYGGPVHYGMRYAKETIVFKDVVFQRGDTIYLQMPAANRDPYRFALPDVLDIGREENKHLSFGQGIHYCLGAPLARIEVQTAIRTLLKRFPNLRLSGEGVDKQSSFVTHGVCRMTLLY
ncbi:MAG: cytochrome P450 [Chloroflexota bacterium]|nr:cytochrome P450 [Chloroflexota bacterium]